MSSLVALRPRRWYRPCIFDPLRRNIIAIQTPRALSSSSSASSFPLILYSPNKTTWVKFIALHLVRPFSKFHFGTYCGHRLRSAVLLPQTCCKSLVHYSFLGRVLIFWLCNFCLDLAKFPFLDRHWIPALRGPRACDLDVDYCIDTIDTTTKDRRVRFQPTEKKR